MLKRIMTVLILLLAVPVFASAANWTVYSNTSPATGQGTISPAGYKTVTNVAPGATLDYVVTPAAGYAIKFVKLGNTQLNPLGATGPWDHNVAQTFRMTYSGKVSETITAYFATASTGGAAINITVAAVTTPAGSPIGGAVREDTFESLTKIKAGSARTILCIPNPGYTAAAPTVTGTPPMF